MFMGPKTPKTENQSVIFSNAGQQDMCAMWMAPDFAFSSLTRSRSASVEREHQNYGSIASSLKIKVEVGGDQLFE
jgi:hypothetical protein